MGVRPYVCETCNKDFTSKYTYKAHIKTHEVRPRPFECTQCNKTFLNQQNLNQHERTHNGIKEHVCHQCGKIDTFHMMKVYIFHIFDELMSFISTLTRVVFYLNISLFTH